MYYQTIMNYKRDNAIENQANGYRRREYREMGFTAKEFADCLQFAVEGELEVSAENPGCYRVTRNDTQIVIDTRLLDARRLGSLVLPVLGVSIDYQGDSEHGYAEFITRFERHFLRMGG